MWYLLIKYVGTRHIGAMALLDAKTYRCYGTFDSKRFRCNSIVDATTLKCNDTFDVKIALKIQ